MSAFEFPDDRPTRDGFPILDVAELVDGLRTVVGEVFPAAWVRGELSNVRPSRAGHVYFVLKDERAQIACVCFRGDAQRIGFALEDGMQVLVGGRVEIYPDRGQLQIIVRQVEPEGVGALALRFEQLKRQLEAEGLFAAEHKQPLPAFPLGVGVVTSPTGSVIRDILNVSGRRMPGIEVVVSPCRVQGDGAEHEIAAAIDRLLRRGGVDAIVVARGGGSLEDLWPFNTETVARAIFACPLPIVSAVGHETDVTIADMVADVRAPTPSAAAELVWPDRAELARQVDGLVAAGAAALRGQLRRHGRDVAALQARLRHPRRTLALRHERLDERWERLAWGIERQLDGRRAALATESARLQAVSPLKVLARGYAMVSDDDGRPLASATRLQSGGRVHLQFGDGRAGATIDHVEVWDEA